MNDRDADIKTGESTPPQKLNIGRLNLAPDPLKWKGLEGYGNVIAVSGNGVNRETKRWMDKQARKLERHLPHKKVDVKEHGS